MKIIRTFLAFLFAFCLTAALGSAAHADSGVFNAHLDVTQHEDGSITVTIPEENASILAEKKPLLRIPCSLAAAEVSHDGESVPSVLEGGQVVFTVEAPGVYVIQEAPISHFAAYTTDTAFNGSVSDIEIDKSLIHVGETVTLSARETLGYRFLGWYAVTAVENGIVKGIGEQLSADMRFTLTAGENTALAAVYEPDGRAVTVTVNTANSARFYIDGESALHDGRIIRQMRLGDTLSLRAAEPEKVLQWLNESDKRLGAGETLSLTITGESSVTLVYAPAASVTQSYVQFVSDYGQVLFAQSCASDSEILFPGAPTKSGYSFTGWVFDGTDETATLEGIRSRIGAENPVITVKPAYEALSENCEITVRHVNGLTGEVMSSELRSAVVGEAVTLRAASFEDLRFDRWESVSGTVLGYKEGYYMQAAGNLELRAVYLPSETEPEIRPVITIGEPVPVDQNGVLKVSCSATRSIPTGYALVEHGILYAKDFGNPSESSIVYGTEGVKRFVSSSTASNGVVKLNVKVESESTTVTFRGYMLLRNEATGDMNYYYTDIVTSSYAALAN